MTETSEHLYHLLDSDEIRPLIHNSPCRRRTLSLKTSAIKPMTHIHSPLTHQTYMSTKRHMIEAWGCVLLHQVARRAEWGEQAVSYSGSCSDVMATWRNNQVSPKVPSLTLSILRGDVSRGTRRMWLHSNTEVPLLNTRVHLCQAYR